MASARNKKGREEGTDFNQGGASNRKDESTLWKNERYERISDPKKNWQLSDNGKIREGIRGAGKDEGEAEENRQTL